MKRQPETFPWVWLSLCLVPSGHAYWKNYHSPCHTPYFSYVWVEQWASFDTESAKKTHWAFLSGSTPASRVRNLRQTLLEVRRNRVLTDVQNNRNVFWLSSTVFTKKTPLFGHIWKPSLYLYGIIVLRLLCNYFWRKNRFLYPTPLVLIKWAPQISWL